MCSITRNYFPQPCEVVNQMPTVHDEVCECRLFCLQIYMYAAWHGWAVPMLLFLAILRLSLNYLIAR